MYYNKGIPVWYYHTRFFPGQDNHFFSHSPYFFRPSGPTPPQSGGPPVERHRDRRGIQPLPHRPRPPDCRQPAAVGGGLRHSSRHERELGPGRAPRRAGQVDKGQAGPAGGRGSGAGLPTVWAVSSAETFARGATQLLAASQVVDALSFGSECGDVDHLCRVARCLNTPEHQERSAALSGNSLPTPPPGNRRWRSFWGGSWPVCSPPPTTTWGWSICGTWSGTTGPWGAVTVRRRARPTTAVLGECAVSPAGGAASVAPPFLSATQLRLFLERGDWGALEPYLPEGSLEVLRAGWTAFPPWSGRSGRCWPGYGPWQRRDWARLPDSGAGRGPPSPAGAGGPAVPLSGGVLRPGQAQALDPRSPAPPAGVGLAGSHPG